MFFMTMCITGTNIRTTDKRKPRSAEAERRQHFNGEIHQDKSHNYYRNNTSDKRRDIDFNKEHRTKHWRAQLNEDRNDRQMLDYRRQGQPFRDSERQMPEESNPYRPKYRNSFKDSPPLEQNQRHRSDNRSDGPHYRHLKMKKRVLTERELREEEEFRRSSVEEVDARDRFGDYGDDTGNEMKDGQYKTDDRNANYDNRMRHEQYQREAPRRNWSDTFGTISLEDKPSLGDVLFGKEPPPRYDKFVLIFMP